MEVLDLVQLFTDADHLDRATGDGPHRQCRAAARVAVDPGQHDTGQGQAGLEPLRHIDSVLAGHRIGDQQNFIGIDGSVHRSRFRHQRLVDLQPAGSVENDHVNAVRLRLGHVPHLEVRLAAAVQRLDGGAVAVERRATAH